MVSDYTVPAAALTRRYAAGGAARQAAADALEALRYHDIWRRLAFHDIQQRFRRSVLGPFWLTLSMGIMVGAMGLVFSTLFKQDVSKTLPYIATGLIFWGLLTSTIIEGTTVFVSNESDIRNVPLPLALYFFRMLTRNVIIFVFNMAIYLVLLGYFRMPIGWGVFAIIPAFILFLANVSWMALAVGIVSTRFRDVPQVVTNFIQVVFFLTPVFWSTETLPQRPAFVDFNPFYHLIEIVRAPLLGSAAPTQSWVFVAAMMAVGVSATWLLYVRAYPRIPYWV